MGEESTDSSSSHNYVLTRYSVAELYFIRAITPLHVGIGRAGGVVDLPIQRDLYGYPMIYASSLKGSFRSLCSILNNKKICNELFGSSPGGEGEATQPSNIVFLDAYPLLIPIRLLKTVYGYMTSPLLLYRYKEYLQLLYGEDSGKVVEKINELLKVVIGEGYEALIAGDKDKITITINGSNKTVINEEYWLSVESSPIIENLKDLLETSLLNKLFIEVNGENVKEAFKNRVLVITDNNDLSLNIIDRSILRVQRIRLEEGVKRVRSGSLWTEEYVPRNTVFYTLILYRDNDASKKFRDNVLKRTGYKVILGGLETIGRGLVELIKMQ